MAEDTTAETTAAEEAAAPPQEEKTEEEGAKATEEETKGGEEGKEDAAADAAEEAEKPKGDDGGADATEKKAEAAADKTEEAAAKEEEVKETKKSSRGREVKSTGTFDPGNFIEAKEKAAEITIKPGRGSKLSSIPATSESINSSKNWTLIFQAHRLVFAGRGGRSINSLADKKHAKETLLEFSGYLEPTVEGEKEEERTKKDEAVEAEMGKRCYKLQMAALKNICDLFAIDRSPPEDKKTVNKDDLVDRLCDFLGDPDEDLTKAPKGAKKKATPKKRKSTGKAPASSGKKKKKKRARKAKVEEYSSSDDESMDGNMPTDKMLKKWVKAYVTCWNLNKATTKHAMETASDKFGVDLTEKKARIKELLADEIAG